MHIFTYTLLFFIDLSRLLFVLQLNSYEIEINHKMQIFLFTIINFSLSTTNILCILFMPDLQYFKSKHSKHRIFSFYNAPLFNRLLQTWTFMIVYNKLSNKNSSEEFHVYHDTDIPEQGIKRFDELMICYRYFDSE